MNDLGERLRRAGELVPPPDDPFDRLVRRRDGHRRRERIVAGAVAMVLAVGVLGSALFVLSRAGRHGTGTPATGSTGQKNPTIKKGKMQGTHLALADGQYLYRRWTNMRSDVAFVVETWWANDGSGRVEVRCITPNCDQSYGFGPQGTFGPGQFPTDDDLTGLSTDPSELLSQLLARTAPGGSSPEPPVSPGPELKPGVTVGGLLYAIDSLLEDPNGSPDLKAAVYDVTAGAETVQVTEGMTDPAGRPATVLEFAYGSDPAMDYYFDPTNHLLMAITSPLDQCGFSTFDQGIVDSTDATPTGGQWLFPESPPDPHLRPGEPCPSHTAQG
jgi:hypothetical protein